MNHLDNENFLAFISNCEGLPINLFIYASERGDVVLLSKVYDFVHSSKFEVGKFPAMTHGYWSSCDASMSPMMAAVRSDNYEVVEFLCLMGRSKDLFTFDPHGVTPFLVCCMRCNMEILCYILYQNLFEINVDDLRVRFPEDYLSSIFFRFNSKVMFSNLQMTQFSGFTPLHMFVKHGELSLLESLCDFGAGNDIIVPASDSSTPVMTACKFGHFDIVKFLFLKNKELQLMDEYTLVNMVNDYGRNAAYEACEYGSFDIFQILCRSSCDIKIKDNTDETLLEFAIRRCSDSEESKKKNRLAILKFMVHLGALAEFPVDLLRSALSLHKHPLSIAFELDLVSVVEVISSYVSESLIREIFPFYLERYPGSLKVIKSISLRLFISTDDNIWLFSILTAYLQEMIYQKSIVSLDFLCFNVFDIHPRLLFRNHFPKINYGDLSLISTFDVEAAVGIRLIELGCLHDEVGYIRTVQAMLIFEGLGPERIASLLQDRIFYLLTVEKTLELKLSFFSDDLLSLILHFAGIVDFISVNHLKDFVSLYYNTFFVPARNKRKRSRLIEKINDGLDSCFEILHSLIDFERSYRRKSSLR